MMKQLHKLLFIFATVFFSDVYGSVSMYTQLLIDNARGSNGENSYYGFQPTVEPTQTTHDLWRRLFDGSPVVPKPFLNFEQLIKSAPECKHLMREMFSAVDLYSEQTVRSRNKEAKRSAKRFQSLFNQDDNCFKAVAASYIVASVLIYDDVRLRCGIMEKSEGCSGREVRSDVLVSSLLVVALFNLDSIKILTPKLRESFSGWDEKGRRGEFRMLGAYDCQSSAIYIDPYHMPYDLGATVFHELQHFLRDRRPLAQSESFFSDWDMEILWDESLAILFGAFTQARIQENILPIPVEVYDGTFVRAINPFHILSDFSLYSKRGTLRKFWGEYPPETFGGLMTDIFSEKKRGVRSKYLKIVADAYWSQLSMKNLKIPSLEEISQYLKFFETRLGLVAYDTAPPNPDWAKPIVDGSSISYLYFDMNEFMQKINILTQDLRVPSVACQKYSEAIVAGKVSPGYHGLKYGAPIRGGESGIRPGESGIRPNTMVRPCLNLRHDVY